MAHDWRRWSKQERQRKREIDEFYLVVSATELSSVLGATMLDPEALLDGKVAPVRDLELADELRDREERLRVLKVHGQLGRAEGFDVVVRAVDNRVTATLLLNLGRRLSVGLDTNGGELHGCSLRYRRVRAQEEHIVLINHELGFHLLDLRGVRSHSMSKDQRNSNI